MEGGRGHPEKPVACLLRTPYMDKNGAAAHKPKRLRRRRLLWTVPCQDSRGAFASEGQYIHQQLTMSRTASTTIEWLVAGKPWFERQDRDVGAVSHSGPRLQMAPRARAERAPYGPDR